MTDELEVRTATEIVDAIQAAACSDPLVMRDAKIRVIANLLKQFAAMEKRIAQLEKIVIGPTVIDCGKF
jgi:hypothetical protein